MILKIVYHLTHYYPQKVIKAPHFKTHLQQYLQYYRANGHSYAQLDPLNLHNPSLQNLPTPIDFGFNYQIDCSQFINFSIIGERAKSMSQIDKQIKRIYVNKVGIQFDHIEDQQQKKWLYRLIEQKREISTAEKKNILTLLIQTQAFDHYLHNKFSTFKRYAGQGSESALVAFKAMFAKAAQQQVKEIVLGMTHRGRLNLLTNLLDYPPRNLFHKIKGKNQLPSSILQNGIDDVTSHIATSVQKVFSGVGCKEVPIKVTMVHNPSHLQAQNAVSMGKTRAKIDDGCDSINMQVHGDGAFCGQGIVYQSLILSKPSMYNIGGTIHLIINNQLGYTTNPKQGRFHQYCSQIGKSMDMPIIHVNGDSVQDVHLVGKMAVQYMRKYKKDILIDLICYRKYGHNQVDQPTFTQPLLYQKIHSKKTTPQIYFEKLAQQKLVSQNSKVKIVDKVNAHLDNEFKEQMDEKKGNVSFLGKWSNLSNNVTGIPIELAKQLALSSVMYPSTFNIHSRINNFHIKERNNQVKNQRFGWTACQAVAIMSLLKQGYGLRFSGQDVQRGTFSQRHFVFTDQKTNNSFSPIQQYSNLCNNNKCFIINSPLAQYGPMSYQYGYSLENPNNLVIWQAQFGDFFNTAQVVIDTFIVCSQEKWNRQTGIVLLLPHGYDGMGPQHSSCRIQRFLQMAATDGINRSYKKQDKISLKNPQDQTFVANQRSVNFNFVNLTNGANFFHALRRQMKRNFRKPLIVAAPKTCNNLQQVLKDKRASVQISKLGEDHFFEALIINRKQSLKQTSKLIICSGKYVYQILQNCKYPVISIQQLLPFPQQQLKAVAQDINKKCEIIWIQQEPMNCGAYVYCYPHLRRAFDRQVRYIGRKSVAASSIGNVQRNKQQSSLLLQMIKNL